MRDKVLLGFLAAVALLQFGYPVTLHGPVWTALYMSLYAVMIVFGVMICRDEGQRTAPAFIVAAVFLVFGLWVAVDQDSKAAHLGMFASVAVFQVVLVHALAAFIFRHSRAHGLELILAAIAVYLLLGGLFAATYGALEILWPQSFEDAQAPGEQVTWQRLMYFSYVTLATLGYGDVLPMTAWARTLAVSGTLFLTTVVARLVGAYMSPDEARGARSE
ncbi:ion channel [Nocardiopsis sp. RSe5-2]|uniref:Ion channel n=1 Tax=Nocardiopsis endophytica TaxID=3018445 RepID=A0ABT4U5J4_9ACTN|nr:ion channel [Nocardiopsis endophytica]MDA2812219.1 ion channel [Nocardiopsis endophytica]